MKKKVYSWMLIMSFMVICSTYSCKPTETPEPPVQVIQGQAGNPRFNLQFDNSNNVDLDLHVITPSGKEISYDIPTADGGTLDLDCICGVCPSGPNENIFWVAGTAPKGTYKFWVEYFDNCGVDGSPSNYTLRLMKNAEVLQTYTGILKSTGSTSPIYSITFQ